MTRLQRRRSRYYELRSMWVKQHLDELVVNLDEDEHPETYRDYMDTMKVEQYRDGIGLKMTFENGVVLLDARPRGDQCVWGSHVRDLVVELRYLFGLQYFRFRTRYDRDGWEGFVLPLGVTVTDFTILPKKYRPCTDSGWRQLRVDEYFFDYLL